MTPNSGTVRCKICGGEARVVTERDLYPVGEREAEIERQMVRCSDCGEEYVTPEQMEENQQAASRRIRKQEGLLQPEQIRYIRTEVLGLTQEELELILGAGPKTVTRWENGTVFQNGTTDRLLRVFWRHPEIAVEIGRELGIEFDRTTVPSPVEALDIGRKQIERLTYRFAEGIQSTRETGEREDANWKVQLAV